MLIVWWEIFCIQSGLDPLTKQVFVLFLPSMPGAGTCMSQLCLGQHLWQFAILPLCLSSGEFMTSSCLSLLTPSCS